MSLMEDETREAPDAVARCIGQRAAFADAAARCRALDPALVMVSARGSSAQAGTFLRYLLARALGVATAAAMPSVVSVYGRPQRLRGALFVTISQSGRSPDLVRQAESARESGALCLALVNDVASPVARACDVVLDIAAGPERSVAATKSVVASLAAALALTAAWTGDTALAAALAATPERTRESLALDWSALEAMLRPVDRALVVGRGPGFPVAAEAALKLCETTGIAAFGFSAAELAHGPRVLAGPAMPVLGFAQDDAARGGTMALLADLAATGVPVLAAGGAGHPGGRFAPLPTLAPTHPDCDLLGYLARFYLVAEAVARARGKNPDRPPGLRKVTETV
jgi:glucosamine--fructose-6-phosphate aminotransferase (isomerizing)